MRKLNLAIATLVSASLLSGCALNKMIKLAADQELTVEPNPLEVHGGEVPFDVSVVLPPKMLPSDKVYTINFIYEYGDQQVPVGSKAFEGDNYPNSSDESVRASDSFSFDYVDGMNPGTLYVRGVASDPGSGKSKETDLMPVAQGLVGTSLLAEPVAAASYADHGYNDQEELIPTTVDFYFPQGVSTLRPSFSVDGEVNSNKTDNLSAFIAEKNVTRTVSITGTHSPEGPERVNENLAENRAKEIEEFYRAQMDKYDYQGVADSISFILKPVVEDWTGLKEALADSDVITAEQADQVRTIINGTGTFVEKEDELHKLPFYNTLLNEVYPGLRTAKTEILTVKEKKSNPTIAVLSKQIVEGETDMDTLSMEEFLFSATLTPSLEEKEAIYEEATSTGAWQAHNNLGAVYLAMAKEAEGSEQTELIQDAVTQLEIAKNKNNSAEVNANLASAYIMQGEYDQAMSALADAESASPSNETASNINAMKGSLQLINGEYDAAMASFNAASTDVEAVTYDKGLTQLLTGDYDAAMSTLDMVDSDELGAKAAYLQAVAAAKSGSAEDFVQYLQTAVERNPELKERALNDLEFSNYSEDVTEAVK